MNAGRRLGLRGGVGVFSLGLVVRLAPLAGCAPAQAAPAERPAQARAPANTQAQFAAALGVSRTQVEAVRALAFAQGVVLIGRALTAPDAAQPAVVVGRRCEGSTGFCAERVLQLGEGLRVEPLALLDLAAPPPQLVLAQLARLVDTQQALRAPALLLRTQAALEGPGGVHRTEQLLLIALSGAASAVILQVESARSAPSGEGFETLTVRFEPARDPPRPDVILLQHALAAHAGGPAQPGAPLSLRLHAEHGAYLRASPTP